MSDINKLIDFVRFSHKVRQTNRAVILDENYENDAEHQHQLSLLALYIIDANNLKLDKFKCAAIAAVHDIVEAYTGDISVFADTEKLASKKELEHKALLQLKKDWIEAKTIIELIEEYENKASDEAIFIYALDKLLPEINNYLYEGKAWKEQNISPDEVEEIKKGKVDLNPTINNYHKQVLQMIKNNKSELFNPEKI